MVRKALQETRANPEFQMNKELIVMKLKEQGCRITKQRLILLDIILEDEYSSIKEIYYRASRQDPEIGTATVYRMINTLESIGAINRKNMYKIVYDMEPETACMVELDDHTVHHLTNDKWNTVILEGLKACGYANEQKIRNLVLQPSHVMK